ncbi:carbohydrate kinase [Aureimonas sp. SA4125]|uniref:carbohydrate kinase family protein n=1 Tax=Aureimonas sp. SA4125 TaxID=2826993 RepID=UPI001CC4D68F|nr:carbohydrate kinase family protein [Aureimonas sp. SA4125]BDA85083.1 carbohydrate kinase [Aureimonas sp. SA4125]
MDVGRHHIFLAGAAHVDRRGRSSARIRLGASNPGTVVESLGGAIFNAGLALRMFGADVTMMSARGGDLEAGLVEASVASAGIVDHSMVWLDRRTATYTAILDERGDLVAGIADMQLYDLLSGRAYSRRHVRAAMSASEGLILDANLPAGAIDALIQSFAGRPVAAIGVSPSKAVRLGERLGALTLLFLSRAEAASLVEASAATGVALLAELLAESGASRVVITDGPSDVAILDHGTITLQAPPAVARLRDVTGAGDTLAATATLAFIDGWPLIEAVRLGMAAASRRIADGSADPQDCLSAIYAIAAAMTPPRTADNA